MAGNLVKLLIDTQIKDPRHRIYLDEILSFADPVDSETRMLAKEIFGAKLTDRYSSEEFGIMALQCPVHDHLHTIPVHNLVEVVDKEGRACEVGQEGRVLVTSMTNPAMPLYRYEIGDRAKWGEPCDSGVSFPVLEPTITRTRDILVDKSGVSFTPTTGKAEFLKFHEISDFQIFLFQDHIVLLAALRSSLNSGQLEQIRLDLAKMFRSDLPVKVASTASLAWLSTWKRRVFFNVAQICPVGISEDSLKSIALGIQSGHSVT
jgi:phenylacetate-CoA ligase